VAERKHGVRISKCRIHIFLGGAKKFSESQPRLWVWVGLLSSPGFVQYSTKELLAQQVLREHGVNFFQNEMRPSKASTLNLEKQNGQG
jgi:hypothetical protein